MINDFEEFEHVQQFGNGTSQWQKTYDDGQFAWLVVDDNRITRNVVRSAFECQELGNNVGCFRHSDLNRY